MTDEFTSPIKERATEELLEIVGAPEKWNPKAVRFANNELVARKVEPKKIETAKYLSKKIVTSKVDSPSCFRTRY
jgi:hypothetical protein